jgi:nitroreductase
MLSDGGLSTIVSPSHPGTDEPATDAMAVLGHGHRAADASAASAPDLLPTDLNDVMVSRRSCREYGPTPVSDTVIASLLDLARRAPSSMDGQPWHFVVVRDLASKAQLVDIKNRYCSPAKQRFRADFLVGAPAIVVVCVDLTRSFGRHLENGVLAAFAIMLAATRHGLGTVYLSATSAEEPHLSTEIRELFEIPEIVLPVSLIPLGYPEGVTDVKTLRPLADMIHYDRFGRSHL